MNQQLKTGVRVHHGDRLGVLADRLADTLDGPRDDPFAADLVCVPGPGVQRWLAQRLSQRLGAVAGDGVCAGVSFSSLTRVSEEAVSAALGRRTDDDPWALPRLPWGVLRAFDAAAGQEWFAPVAAHLAAGDEARPGRRYGTARRLAELYARWLRWRPTDLEAWLTGGDPWQARLWRLVVDAVGDGDPFALRRQALARLSSDPDVVSLPPEWHIFAPGSVPPAVIDTVAAISARRTVEVWIAVPGDGGFGASLGRTRRIQAEVWRSIATTLDRPGREVPARPPVTLLGALQAVVRGEPVAGAYEADGSVVVHGSHGPERQVEVLRDVLVDLLQRDPTLEPRHILVVTPELETYGPLVRARSGLGHDSGWPALHPVHDVRVSVADRSLSEANPVLAVLLQVLDLATSRATVAEVLDLCAAPPVARRFGFRDPATIERLGVMTRGAGVRWGLDADARRPYGLSVPFNTWQTGLNRLLVGLTMSERNLAAVGTALPYDIVETQDVATLGSLAELAGRIRAASDLFRAPATPTEWARRFRQVLLGEVDDSGALIGGIVSVSAADGWQVTQAHAQLTSIAELAGADAPPLSLGDVKALVRERLQGRLVRSALLTGALTVTSLDALPQVPHRVVVALGVDEQSFPRPVIGDGDDVLGRAECEPNPGRDDRQAFLDAVMSAEQSFIVVHQARDPRTNEEVPSSIPVRELVEAAAGLGAGVVIHHRLQPFDVDGHVDDAPPTYSVADAAAARALADARSDTSAEPRDRNDVTGIGPAPATREVSLDQLAGFLRHPLRWFRQTRLGLAGQWSTTVDDEIPIELPSLSLWSLKNSLLHLRLQGLDRAAVETAERLRGTIPPGERGFAQLRDAADQVEGVVARTSRLLAETPRDLQVSLPLPCGITLGGRVKTYGDVVVQPLLSWPKGKSWADPWVRLLGASAVRAETSEAVLVTDRGDHRLRPPDDPAAMLDSLASLYLRGLDQVVPMPPDTAYELARTLCGKRPDDRNVRKEWGFEKGSWSGFLPGDYDDLLRERGDELRLLAQEIYVPIVERVGR